MATGLGALQYVLDEGERNDWLNDGTIRSFALLAVAALASFVYWELRVAKRPIVDLRILKNKVVAAGCLLAMVLAFSLFGGVILAPQFQQSLLNFTATLSGESILLRALAIAAMTPVCLILLNRFKIQPRVLLGAGFLIVALANYLNARIITTESDFGTFVSVLVLGGAGFGLLFVPLSVTVLNAVSGADTQKATSLLSLCQQLGGSISTATLVTLLDRRGAEHLSHLAGEITARNHAVELYIAQHRPMGQLFGIVSQQATTMSFADAFVFLAVITVLLTPLVLLLKAPKQRSTTAAAVD
jgi:DHA2 family multidrug resistance protein